MSSLIQTIVKQAESTFSKALTDESFSTSLSELLQSVNEIKASDLNINPDTMWKDDNAKRMAPIANIPVYFNEKLTIDVFVMQDGAGIPVHDHPGMHSINKVIHGNIRVAAYNLTLEDSKEPEVMPKDIIEKMAELRLNNEDSLIPVELYTSKVLTCNDEPFLTTPTIGNFHEICAINGTAAVFDILAPPYGDNRRFSMYSLLETTGADSKCKMWLAEVLDMRKHWMNQIAYTGPGISI